MKLRKVINNTQFFLFNIVSPGLIRRQSTNYEDGTDLQDFLEGLKLVLIKSQRVTCLVILVE